MRDLPHLNEVSLADAAHRLGRPYNAAYSMMLEGTLRGRRVGRRWYVQAADVVRIEKDRADGALITPAIV